MDAKTKKSIPPDTPGYRHLTSDDRVTIWALKKVGICNAEISRQIGCDRATVGRELKRNKSMKGYRPTKAQEMADARIMAKAAGRRKLTDPMWREAMDKLALGWTFEQIAGRAKRDGKPTVSRETYYKEYYRRQRLVLNGESDEVLPPLPRCQRKRRARDRNVKKYRTAGRGQIPDRVDIDQRPNTVENRARVGHWEGDLINGVMGTGNLVTIAERKTRFTFVSRAATKETDLVMRVIIDILSPLPKGFLKSITFDNGKEFAAFKQLVQALGTEVYFAKPYHSCERGTSENRNGIVRKVLPKGTPFDNISDAEMRRIDYMLNDRPLKCLNWRTPREAFTALLNRHLKIAA